MDKLTIEGEDAQEQAKIIGHFSTVRISTLSFRKSLWLDLRVEIIGRG